MRERISRALIERKGFSFVAIEGDWPDAARIDHYVRHADTPPSEWTAFARFPTWMWRNREVREFVDWLRGHNHDVAPENRVAFHGLDLYSLYNSIRSVSIPGRRRSRSCPVARERYGCLTPWQSDPATYGHATMTRAFETCERKVVAMLADLLEKRRVYAEHDGARFLDAMQNARLVANAERYYRIMYYGSRESWNLRDTHMFDTLKTLLGFHGPRSKAIVWAHNSHVGDSDAPRWLRAASTTSAGCAGRSSAPLRIRSASAPTTARLPPRRTGTGRWRSRTCGHRRQEATSAFFTKPAWRDASCRCGTRPGPWPTWRTRGWSVRSA
jgi:protein-L-isoaspartate(D-aspartate) O-methyltransferase